MPHLDVKLHFGDEQFEVDAAQLPVAFAQVTLGERGEGRRVGGWRRGRGIKRHVISEQVASSRGLAGCWTCDVSVCRSLRATGGGQRKATSWGRDQGVRLTHILLMSVRSALFLMESLITWWNMEQKVISRHTRSKYSHRALQLKYGYLSKNKILRLKH